jgi:hypothetical protein
MPSRAILSARLVTLLGLAIGFACTSAAPQDLSLDRQATVDQRSRTAPIGNALLSSSLPVADPPSSYISIQTSTGRGNPLWAVPVASLTATRERPIFSPSRRPPAVVDPPRLQAESTPINFQSRQPLLSLLGAIAGEAEGIAIFLDETTKGIVRLKTGESHSGWVLRSVQGAEVTLQRGPETAIVAIPNPLAK